MNQIWIVRNCSGLLASLYFTSQEKAAEWIEKYGEGNWVLKGPCELDSTEPWPGM